MDTGWIKLHRSLIKDKIWTWLTDKQLRATIGLLLEVNWEPGEWMCRQCNTVLTINPGSTVKSVRNLAQSCKVSRSTMQVTLKKLCESGFMFCENPGQCHKLYTIKNWDKFQSNEESQDTDGTGTGQVRDIYKKKKKNKNNKNTNTNTNTVREDYNLEIFVTEKTANNDKAKKATTKRDINDPATKVLDHWREAYNLKFGAFPVISWGGKDRAIATTLLADRSVDEVIQLIDNYLLLNDEYTTNAGYPLALLPSKVGNILASNRKNQPRDYSAENGFEWENKQWND